ncbi:helicase [Tissierella sp. P1]|uniref:DEAD/DEAH box helicase n=1 Tax=Tissierella sp. P1 TaxID=1280483 RepID=UPI000BA05B92|nr:DEAD/DEAH box helicase [Tissierella sp. P1]OZV10840.1 helicase [Tissierella sp. P1]
MKLFINYIEKDNLASLSVDNVEISWLEIQRLCEERAYGGSQVRYDSLTIPWWKFISLKSDLKFLFIKHNLQPILSDKVISLLKESARFESQYKLALLSTPLAEDDISYKLKNKGFKRTLTDQQLRNVTKMSMLPAAATFSVPGAGKTTEALAYFTLTSTPETKLLVVAPKNAFIAWDDEIKECLYSQEEVIRLAGGYNNIQLLLKNKPKYSIITYQQLPNVLNLISEYLIENDVFMFLDESHRIKQGSSGIIGGSILSLSHLPKQKLIMSGTPMPNRVDDLISQFNFLYPEIHCTGDDIANKIKPIYVRTTKKELNLDKNRKFSIHYVEMNPNQRKLYQLLCSEQARIANKYLKSRDRTILRNIGKSVLRMIQITSNPRLLANSDFSYHNILKDVIREGDSPKIKYVCKRARELAHDGKRVVIWSSFVNNVELIAERLSDLGAEYIHGQVESGDENDPETREAKIRRFHNKEENCFVLVANPAAASEGISLHKVCNHAIYLDRNYNAAQFLQSMDRIHRLGLPENVISEIEIVACRDSIDEIVHNRLFSKIQDMEVILNDDSIQKEYEYFDEEVENINDISEDDIIDYINHLTQQGGEY